MKVRSYEHDDESAVIALWQACGLLRPWNDPQPDIQRKLQVQPDLFLVGTVEGANGPQLVATAMLGYEGHRGWVNYLAVAPALQGQGLGRHMMREAEIRLVARGCPKLNLLVRRDNEGVLGFYRALGYDVDATLSLGKRLIVDPAPTAGVVT